MKPGKPLSRVEFHLLDGRANKVSPSSRVHTLSGYEGYDPNSQLSLFAVFASAQLSRKGGRKRVSNYIEIFLYYFQHPQLVCAFLSVFRRYCWMILNNLMTFCLVSFCRKLGSSLPGHAKKKVGPVKIQFSWVDFDFGIFSRFDFEFHDGSLMSTRNFIKIIPYWFSSRTKKRVKTSLSHSGLMRWNRFFLKVSN